MAFAEWCGLQSSIIPELKLLYHVPNGGARPWQERVGPDGRKVRYSVEGQKLRKMGVKKGVPDYHLPVARRHSGQLCLGLWIEFKSKDGKQSDEQVAFAAALEQHGHMIFVAKDWEQARYFVVQYLGMEGIEIVGAKQ